MHRREFSHSLAALAAIGAAAPSRALAAPAPSPVGAQGRFQLVKDWTFGRSASGATVHDMNQLRREFFFRYIYDHGRLEKLDKEWSRHLDYPEGDPRTLHAFTADALVLKARVPPGGGMHDGGIESGMLRAALPVEPGMYVEMSAKLPRGLGVWPAFWLNPGVETADGEIGPTPWPPEIDIFEFYVWQGRDAPRIMECNTQDNGDRAKYGGENDLFTVLKDGKLDTGIDYSADYHTFALDWVKDKPVWMLDGKKIKQTTYSWPGPPAHILITNQIGMTLNGVDLGGMKASGDNWDYSIRHLRVWRRS